MSTLMAIKCSFESPYDKQNITLYEIYQTRREIYQTRRARLINFIRNDHSSNILYVTCFVLMVVYPFRNYSNYGCHWSRH